jgi:hypothetical protein
MRCLHCSRRIGLIRRVVDRQFCCDDHRRKARLAYSARVSRDLEEPYEDGWLVTTGTKKKAASFGPGSALLMVIATVLLAMFLPSSQQAPSPPPSYLPPTGAIGEKLARALPTGSLSLREDFNVDLRNWQSGFESVKDGWAKTTSGVVQVGQLRLWKPTLSLGDYNMEFEAQIENRALGWAFRAGDPKNYYASKIHLTRQGTKQRAEIIRYVVAGGKQFEKKELPIPLVVVENMVYGVKVAIKGNRFITTVNGQVVDSWTDNRHRRGGVGFFSEPGEKAVLRWVAVSEPKGMLERLISFGLFVPPPGMIE